MSASLSVKIPFASLEFANHTFNFVLTNAFFQDYGYEGFVSCDLNLNMNVTREEALMIVRNHFHGHVVVECDRCLGDLTLPLDFVDVVYVKVGHDDNDDSVINLTKEEDEVNLSDYVYETVILALPPVKIHPDDENGISTCDIQQLEILNQYHNHGTTDPRWEILKDLKID